MENNYFLKKNKPVLLVLLVLLCLVALSSAPIPHESYKGGNVSLTDFIIQAEDFDKGEPGVAYSDTTPDKNEGGAYRSEGVDISKGIEFSDDYYCVGWIFAGEWLLYSDIKGDGGTYTVQARIASVSETAGFHIEVNGVKAGQSVMLPKTGGWTEWQLVDVGTVTLNQGTNTIKFVAETDGFNIDYLSFKSTKSVPSLNLNHSYSGSTVTFAGTIDAPAGTLQEAVIDWNDGSAPQVITGGFPAFTVSHTYADYKSYNVRIDAKDSTGQVSTKLYPFTIHRAPVPAFTILQGNTVEVGEEVIFSAAPTTEVTGFLDSVFEWDLGDARFSKAFGAGVSHYYSRPGQFDINLTVTNKYGISASTSGTITVEGVGYKMPPLAAAEPVLELKFEDTLADSSLNNHRVTWAVNPGSFTDGIEGRALDLSAGNYVKIDNFTTLNNKNAFTLSFWAKNNLENSEHTFIKKDLTFEINLHEKGNKMMAGVRTNQGVTGVEYWYTNAKDTNWHHYILQYDGSMVRLFFDGVELICSQNKCPRPQTGQVFDNNEPLYIGYDPFTKQLFNGIIDEVKIYDSVLTVEEISRGFELWHANFQGRTAQYIYAQLPGMFTKDPANRITATISGGALGTDKIILLDKTGLASEEKFLLKNAELKGSLFKYHLTVTITDGAGNVLEERKESFLKDYDGVPDVGIDENNAIRVKGELFYPVTPFGLTFSEIDNWYNNKYINMLYAQGFWPKSYLLPDWLDYLATNPTIKAIGPGGGWDGNEARNSSLDKIAAYVNAAKDHPGTGMWIWRDEPGLGNNDQYIPASVLRSWTGLCHMLDPQHLVATNLAGPFFLGDPNHDWGAKRAREYTFLNSNEFLGIRKPLFDVYGVDYYPVDWAAPNKRGATVDNLMFILNRMKEWNYDLVPFMSFVETCEIGEEDRPTPWHPTPEQLKMLVWLNVVGGAKGINWFPWHSGTPPENFPVMAEFTTQITELTPVVLGPEMEKTVTISYDKTARIETMVREHQGKTYLFAVRLNEFQGQSNGIATPTNPNGYPDPVENYPVTAALNVEGIESCNITVYSENRTFQSPDGTFTDTFEPYEVHIYIIEPSTSYDGGNTNLTDFVIEAEKYDLGGEGVAYHDSTATNLGGQFRQEDVDIEKNTDGTYRVGYTVQGEWLRYSDIKGDGGLYNVSIRSSSQMAVGKIHLEVNGVDVTGTVELQQTGGWSTFIETSMGQVTLPAGNNEIKLVIECGYFDIDSFRFIKVQ